MRSGLLFITLSFASGLLLGAAGCASGEVHHDIVLARDAKITVGSAQPLTMKKGEHFDLGSEPALVESPGQISVLLIPPQEGAGSGKITVGLKPGTLDDAHASPAAANDLIFAVDSIEALVSAGKFTQADEKLSELEERYPKAGTLKFLRARVLYAQGSKIQGQAVFDEARKEVPGLKLSKDFLESAGPRRVPAGKSH